MLYLFFLIFLPYLLESRTLRKDGNVLFKTFLPARDYQNIINLTKRTLTDISELGSDQRRGNQGPSSDQGLQSVQNRKVEHDYFFQQVQNMLNQEANVNQETGRISSDLSLEKDEKFLPSALSASDERKHS